MAKDNNVANNTQLMAQVINSAGGNQSPEMNRVAELLAKKLERELLAEDDSIAQLKAAQKANAENMVLIQRQKDADQAACPHIKPRGMGTALAGQKTHRGWATYVCQYCGKQFSAPPQRPEEQIPPHLYPDAAMVGGPH